MNPIILIFLSLVLTTSTAQDLSGQQLLEKAIQYHDPGDAWRSFQGKLSITSATPDKSDRTSEVILDLPAQYYKIEASRDGETITYVMDKGSCLAKLNGNSTISESDAQIHNVNCERGKSMKDYYTYLYGLPMKLKDPGTKIDPEVTKRNFKGKQYLVLKATYAEGVGQDTWYFYFDPSTYAMGVYQFYHDESKNDGEYILLNGEVEVSGIRMPQARTWYYNKDDTYLGTDTLTKATAL
jgi:hypothetical protein